MIEATKEKIKAELASLDRELAAILTPDVMARVNFISGAKATFAHMLQYVEEQEKAMIEPKNEVPT